MKENSLLLIPKYEDFIQYMIEIIIKLPRTEKFNIGNELKTSMYETLENIIYLEKIDKYQKINYLNKIDAKINLQRILLRIMLKNLTYKHGGYKVFYVTQPKLRKIEKSRYIDRIVHRWYVDSFMQEYFVKQYIHTSYACIKNNGMHKAVLELQKSMKHCKNIWQEYYILKMDVKKFFQNINKDILLNILLRKIKDPKLIWLTKEIIYSSEGKKGLPIGNYTSQIFVDIKLMNID